MCQSTQNHQKTNGPLMSSIRNLESGMYHLRVRSRRQQNEPIRANTSTMLTSVNITRDKWD